LINSKNEIRKTEITNVKSVLPARLDQRTYKTGNSLGSTRRCLKETPCYYWRASQDKW